MTYFRNFSTHIAKDYLPNSKVKIFRKTKNKSSPKCQTVPEYAENLAKIQMISSNLHKQIFPNNPRLLPNSTEKSLAEKYVNVLKHHGLDISSTQQLEDVILKLPPLKGKNIEDHFFNIAREQIQPYREVLESLSTCKRIPERPKVWSFQKGWTVYDPGSKNGTSIDFPKEKALVFDVEVCVKNGAAPILATAVGEQHWYSWVSPLLLDYDSKDTYSVEGVKSKRYTLEDLIPLGDEESSCKIIVGHNVSYDRARIREQYLLEDTGVRFVDTMSLHVCISGITSYQRAILQSKKETPAEDLEWSSQSSLNNLVDVHRLYCIPPGSKSTLSKEPRNIFLEGTLDDVRSNFQYLVNYCASDVEATHQILQAIYPLFIERFPHPVTLAGMLEMGSAYLPVNTNWSRYLNESDLTYEDLSIESKYYLSRRADEACALLKDNKYKDNLWLWDEDWSTQELKLKKTKKSSKDTKETSDEDEEHISSLPKDEQELWRKFKYLYDTKKYLPARRPFMPGYPSWYRKLCKKVPLNSNVGSSPDAPEISTGMKIAPKLLSLCWEGYPLHYMREHGWGFLVPCRNEHPSSDTSNQRIPIKSLVQRCPIPEFLQNKATASESDDMFEILQRELDAKLTKREYFSKTPKKERTDVEYKGSGVWCDVLLEGCCYFVKLPHKNGKSFNVGNPLSRDFLNKFSENVLTCGDTESNSAVRVVEIARMMSYWRNNRDRIIGQVVVWLPAKSLPESLRAISIDTNNEYGAICPQIVVCGTLTRRAMEPTWMTASNSKQERIGSELRAMVQAPPSYKIVGADVDSQELWIASVLGDAYAYGMHGSTPLGWMTLSGTKSNSTDMHSVTAKAVGISRDHAKVINYARIYGAGQNFAEGLLKQFNPAFTATEAKGKAMKMYSITKGKRVYIIKKEFEDEYGSKNFTAYEASKIALSKGLPLDEIFNRPTWQGGTESAMFNRLEEIACQENPVTPFLSCRLSRALEANQAHGHDRNRYLPTRVNWVVQSGAVDFLHLMLVSMRWLMGPNLRFCLSFHDELRYLVKEDLAYKAALAMHVTNLLTRSFCSSRIGLFDLPMSVAFFSSVEVDTVLRKESTMDCKTPSNPHGLKIGYGIPPGESININESIRKAGGNDLSQWQWIK